MSCGQLLWQSHYTRQKHRLSSIPSHDKGRVKDVLGRSTIGAKKTSSYILQGNFLVFSPFFLMILSPNCIATSVSKSVQYRSLARVMTARSTALERSTSAQGKEARRMSLVKYSVISSPPYFKFMRESGMIMPSSTQAIVVVWAPMSTTQALERPAPNVAHIASYSKCQYPNCLEYCRAGRLGIQPGGWRLLRSPCL